MLISKIDFNGVIEISANIADAKINPIIVEAERLDFFGIIGNDDSAIYKALQLVKNDSANWITWAQSSFEANVKVIHLNRIWKNTSGVSTTGIPGTSSDWAKQELDSFWYNHVKRFLVYKTFARLSPTHGIHFGQHGFRISSEPNSIEVEPSERRNIIKKAEMDASVEQNLMMDAISDASWTFDTVQYAQPSVYVPTSRTKNFGVKAVRHRRDRPDRDFSKNN